MFRQVLAVAALSLALAAGAAQAQTPKPVKPNPVMRGAIQDTLGQALDGAQIEILALKRVVTTTTTTGSYRFDDIKPGKYWVAVRRIGYAPLRAALTLNQGDDREIVFQLEPLAHLLPEVKVQAEDKRWMRRYQDFVWRSRSSFGQFLTRDDIEKSRAAYLGDIVRRYLPFTTSDMYFMSSWTASSSLSRGSRLGRNCPPAISLNGGRPMGGWAVNDFQPEDVEALEVYRNGYQMPTEFVGWDLPCGLVVVWTQSR
jgi:hypothetical protein